MTTTLHSAYHAVTEFSFDDGESSVTIAVGEDPVTGLRRSQEGAPPGWQATPVGELIAKLGSFKDSDAIAEFFRTEGIRGDRGKPSKCPIQKWLQVMTGERYQVGAYAVRDGKGRTVAPLPFQAFRFVTEFDGGKYRDLATNNHHPDVKAYDATHADQVADFGGFGMALHEYTTGTKDAAW